MRRIAILVLAGLVLGGSLSGSQPGGTPASAAAPQTDRPPDDGSDKQQTPEQKMQRRFPQPVRAGFLIGLPVLDWQDSTIGYIRQVVRTPDGKIKLIVPYGRWLGWIGDVGPADRWRRPVAVPIETVAILGQQVDALEMSRADFEAAPAFAPSSATAIPANETLQIAITRR